MRNTYWIRKERLDQLPDSLARHDPWLRLGLVCSCELGLRAGYLITEAEGCQRAIV
jgi:hypothetical protein